MQGEVARARSLSLFRYAFERGYIARHVGKYDQEAKHVGNGDAFRQFRSMGDRYSPHNLPASVLNALCGKDGSCARALQGLALKKAPIDQRWRPSRRMTRTSEDDAHACSSAASAYACAAGSSSFRRAVAAASAGAAERAASATSGASAKRRGGDRGAIGGGGGGGGGGVGGSS